MGDDVNSRYGASRQRRRRRSPMQQQQPSNIEDDDDNSSVDSSLEPSNDEDDRLAQEYLWKEYLSMVPVGPRELCFHPSLVVDEQCLDRFIAWISHLPEGQRPQRLLLFSRHISDSLGTAYRMDQLIELCTQDITMLFIANMEGTHSPRAPYAKLVYSEILASTSYLKELRCLRLQNTKLSRPSSLRSKLAQCLSSKHCKLETLSMVNCNLERMDSLAPALERYSGLQDLCLRNCGLDRQELHRLITAVEKSPSRLVKLCLQLCDLENKDLPMLSSMITAQSKLEDLDLAQNHLFANWSTEDDDYYVCNDDTGFLQVAFSVHPCLKTVRLAFSPLDTVAFRSILTSVAESKTIKTLDLCRSCDNVHFDDDWIDLIPHIRSLKSLYGLEDLTCKRKWASLVAPALHYNMSLQSLIDPNVGDGEDLILFDKITTGTLLRNKLLSRLGEFPSNGDPPLGLWPMVLEKFAAHDVEQSALFAFLQTKSSALDGGGRWTRSRKRTAIGLEEENRILHSKIKQLERENIALRLEKSLRLNESLD